MKHHLLSKKRDTIFWNRRCARQHTTLRNVKQRIHINSELHFGWHIILLLGPYNWTNAKKKMVAKKINCVCLTVKSHIKKNSVRSQQFKLHFESEFSTDNVLTIGFSFANIQVNAISNTTVFEAPDSWPVDLFYYSHCSLLFSVVFFSCIDRQLSCESHRV